MKKMMSVLMALALSFQVKAADTFLKAPDVPQYETCKLISVNQKGVDYQIQDQACNDRNATKSREYGAMVESYNRQMRITTAAADTLTRPAAPTYENCGNTDKDCLARNQNLQRDYSIQSQAWDVKQQNEAVANQAKTDADLAAQQQAAAAAAQASSATAALQTAQDQNKKAESKSNLAGTLTMAASVGFGVAFAASCVGAGATCNYGFLAASIGFGIMSALNKKQASENANSAYQACQTQAQLASGSVNCGTAPDPYVATANQPTSTALVPTVFDANGNCVATEKILCDQVKATLPAGTDIKSTIKGLSSFASPYKFNADGSVTTKDGKTFKAADFKDKDALIAAGLTPDQASAAMASLSKSGLSAPGSGLENAKADLKDNGSGKFNADFAGTTIAGTGAEGNGKGLGSSGALGSKGIDGSGKLGLGKNRNPAGEGLTRDFNGEAIGAAGDDIFSMMNRRYKMKTAQDSFISN